MIELKHDYLEFSFPEVHKECTLRIELQRTLRIPDDDKTYPLPPGLGRFPLRHVDGFAHRVPDRWIAHGGVMLPMYQSEAMWLNFQAPMADNRAPWPFAVKVATGKINAVSGEPWCDGLHRDPQDYLAIPEQPWLDGYCVETGVIRQFVAMPLGSGYSAEEQMTGAAEHGGLQIMVFPMKADAFRRRFRTRDVGVYYREAMAAPCAAMPDMGLAPGGRMRQKIYDDPYDLSDWDLRQKSRCFVHITNSLVWRAIANENPPTTPPTAAAYTRAGLPWFDYYSDGLALKGAKTLERLKSVATRGRQRGEVPLGEDTAVVVKKVVELRKGMAETQVREMD